MEKSVNILEEQMTEKRISVLYKNKEDYVHRINAYAQALSALCKSGAILISDSHIMP